MAAIFDVPAQSLLVSDPTPGQPALKAMYEGALRGLGFTGTTPRSEFWWFALAVAMLLAFAELLSEEPVKADAG